MDEKLSEKNGKTLQAPKEDNEMNATVTTQLENLIVTIDSADMSSKTQSHTEVADLCKSEDCDDDDSKDSDRY